MCSEHMGNNKFTKKKKKKMIIVSIYSFIINTLLFNKKVLSSYVSYHFFNVSGADILFLYLLTNFEKDASFFVMVFFLPFN